MLLMNVQLSHCHCESPSSPLARTARSRRSPAEGKVTTKFSHDTCACEVVILRRAYDAGGDGVGERDNAGNVARRKAEVHGLERTLQLNAGHDTTALARQRAERLGQVNVPLEN